MCVGVTQEGLDLCQPFEAMFVCHAVQDDDLLVPVGDPVPHDGVVLHLVVAVVPAGEEH